MIVSRGFRLHTNHTVEARFPVPTNAIHLSTSRTHAISDKLYFFIAFLLET